jgi:hypothetical protein
VRALKGELSVDVVLPKQVGSFRVVSKEKKIGVSCCFEEKCFRRAFYFRLVLRNVLWKQRIYAKKSSLTFLNF